MNRPLKMPTESRAPQLPESALWPKTKAAITEKLLLFVRCLTVCGGVMLKTVVLIEADETADCHKELHMYCPVSASEVELFGVLFLSSPQYIACLATVRILGEHGHLAREPVWLGGFHPSMRRASFQ